MEKKPTNLKVVQGGGNIIKCPLPKPVNATAFLAEQSMVMERARVAAQVRLSHIKKYGASDKETEEVMKRTKSVEDFVDSLLKSRTDDHPTAPWLKQITGCVTKKGILAEPICKVIGMIDSFGKYYPKGDMMIPAHITCESETDETGQEWIWVEGIERFTTPSKLNKFACMDPGNKQQKGKLNTGSKQLKTVLFRVMSLLFMMTKNRYYDHYISYKAWKTSELIMAGKKIRPTPAGRYCAACEEEFTLKAGLFCPKCGEKLSKKEEPEGVVWEGHLDMMCRRQTLKLFLSHLWVVYRQAKNLSVRAPYPVEHMEGQHATIIDPWEMCDLLKNEKSA
jgi:hypothetical protein